MIQNKRIAPAFIAVSLFGLSACDLSPPEPIETPDPAAPVSIFRPEAEVPPVEEPLAQLEASVSFAGGGNDLSDAAMAQLATIIGSPQMKLGGSVILRGHTDSAGYDEANLRASKKRAETVRSYLIENGVADSRIEVIALGEMRPVAPNAMLDGTPDDAGRAANRRVDVTIAVPGAPASSASPAAGEPTPKPTSSTLVEAIIAPD